MQLLTKFGIIPLLTSLFFLSCKKEPTDLNSPPVANAGPDQNIVLPQNVVLLDGSGSTDPDNNITSYAWSRISGPLQFRILQATTVQTQASYLIAGVYLFELTVTDAKGLSSKDTVQVTVSPFPVNNDPVSIIAGTATLTPFGSLSNSKFMIPATAADKLVFAGGYVDNWQPTASVDIYNLSTNSWSTAQLSEPRFGMTVVTVASKILYAGGIGNANASSGVDIYDAAANTWTKANLSAARSSMISTVSGNKAFLAGSENDVFTNRVEIYDASSNAWSSATLSETRTGASAIAVGNKVMFAGGYKKYDGIDDSPYDFSKRVDIYDITTNTWSTAELKEARTGMTLAVVGNKALFAGGYFVTDPKNSAWSESNQVDIYDALTNTWSTATLNVKSQGMVAATVGNKVLFAGGYINGSPTSRVEMYDAATNNWSVAALSTARGVSSTAKLGNKVLFFTGYPDYNRIDVYDAATNTWSMSELNKALYSIPIVAGNVVFIGGGEVHTIGTSANNQLTSTVSKLEF